MAYTTLLFCTICKRSATPSNWKPWDTASHLCRIAPCTDWNRGSTMMTCLELEDDWAVLYSTQQNRVLYCSREHAVSKLIAQDILQIMVGHSGREHSVAPLREQYFFSQPHCMRDTVLKICFVCRRNNGKPTKQPQAHLPERIQSWAPSFSSSGVGCFGLSHKAGTWKAETMVLYLHLYGIKDCLLRGSGIPQCLYQRSDKILSMKSPPWATMGQTWLLWTRNLGLV